MKLGYDNISINGGVQVKRSEPRRPLQVEKKPPSMGGFFVLSEKEVP